MVAERVEAFNYLTKSKRAFKHKTALTGMSAACVRGSDKTNLFKNSMWNPLTHVMHIPYRKIRNKIDISISISVYIQWCSGSSKYVSKHVMQCKSTLRTSPK